MNPPDDASPSLEQEVQHYQQEKEKIRHVIGQIGGAQSQRRDTILNIVFIVLLSILLGLDLLGHWVPSVRLFPSMLSVELGVLMVSLKIIWMIHKQSRLEHFQFWILHSIEFRLNELSRRMQQQGQDEAKK